MIGEKDKKRVYARVKQRGEMRLRSMTQAPLQNMLKGLNACAQFMGPMLHSLTHYLREG